MQKSTTPVPPTLSQPETIRGYYKWHAKIYDLTRWTFLFGRKQLPGHLNLGRDYAGTVLEVGCGTGYNLRRLAKAHPQLSLIGVDVSPDMLQKATAATQAYSRRVLLLEAPYAPGPLVLPKQPDVVLFSYALTMFNPGWEAALQRAYDDLPVGGRIAVVDFHDTPSAAFRHWLGQNHVRFDGHLLPALEALFRPLYKSVDSAYGGLWRYVSFIGQKEG